MPDVTNVEDCDVNHRKRRGLGAEGGRDAIQRGLLQRAVREALTEGTLILRAIVVRAASGARRLVGVVGRMLAPAIAGDGRSDIVDGTCHRVRRWQEMADA